MFLVLAESRKFKHRLLPSKASAGSWRNCFCLARNTIYSEVGGKHCQKKQMIYQNVWRTIKRIKLSIYVKEIALNDVSRLALNTMTLQVTSVNVNSGQGVAISVTGIAQVNVVLERMVWPSLGHTSYLSQTPQTASVEKKMVMWRNSPHDMLSSGKFLHMIMINVGKLCYMETFLHMRNVGKICHMEKFLHMRNVETNLSSGKFLHMRKVEKICHMEIFLHMRDVEKICQVKKFSTW